MGWGGVGVGFGGAGHGTEVFKAFVARSQRRPMHSFERSKCLPQVPPERHPANHL